MAALTISPNEKPNEKPTAVTTRGGLNFVLMLAPLNPGRNSDNELVHAQGGRV